MKINNTLIWRDPYVSIFDDDGKEIVILVNDRCSTKAMNYTSNFFSVEDLVINYDILLKESTKDNEEDHRILLDDFIKYILEQGYDLDFDLLKDNFITYTRKEN